MSRLSHALLPEFARRPLRPVYRAARARYLRTVYPSGGVLRCHGIDVYCDFTHPSYAWYDSDSESVRFSLNLLAWLISQAEGDTFLDVGAHFGLYAAGMARILAVQNRAGTILAIEPDKRNFRCLEETARRADGHHVVPIFAAAGESDGVTGLFDSGESCLHSYGAPGSRALYEVPRITVATALQQYSGNRRLAVVKVDIDGAEPAFFDGARDVLAQHRPLIITEFCPTLLTGGGTKPAEFYQRLCHDFSVYWVHRERWPIGRVGPDDYSRIVAEVADGVTDLLLASGPLTIPSVMPRTFF